MTDNFILKELKGLIKITKKEKDYLLSQGFMWHKDIFATTSNNRTYYLREDKKVLNCLNTYRNECNVSFK